MTIPFFSVALKYMFRSLLLRPL